MRNSTILLIPFAAACLILTACGDSAARAAAIATGGDPLRGRAGIVRYGCGSCHTIAGISSAHGLVGPALTGIRERLYVAGVLRNSPDNLTHWIRNPKEVDSKTGMPVLGLSNRDASDIAAYLYSIP
jgi:cytochrome c2